MLARYRAQWARVGAVIALLVGAATVAAGRRLSRPQVRAVFGVVVPNMVMPDRNSPYAFTGKQMGPYDVEAASGTR